jgi:hypothetical protein
MVDQAYQRLQFPPGKGACREATQYLQMIAHVTIKEPGTNGHDGAGKGCSSDINAKLMRLNQQGGLDAHTCIIDLMSIRSLWHTINGANSSESETNQQEGAEELI